MEMSVGSEKGVMPRRHGKLDFALIVSFLISMGLVGWGTHVARRAILTRLDTPTQQASWDDWREETQRLEARPQHAQRRAASSQQLPAVVLLTDHFAAVLVGVLVTLSVPIGVLHWLLRAALLARHVKTLSPSGN